MASITGNEALFIDIDDTITTFRKETPDGPPNKIEGQSLLWLMAEHAHKTQGMPREQAAAIIRVVCRNVNWWTWCDFICELGLSAADFWEYAYLEESKYLTTVDAKLPRIIESLCEAGYRLFITSNNPSSGQLIKLRIAGLAKSWGSPYFLQYFGPPELHYMKWNMEFWQRALAHTGLSRDEVITVGDAWRDDVEKPREAGITRSIHLDLRREFPDNTPTPEGVWRVRSWQEIADLLLKKKA